LFSICENMKWSHLPVAGGIYDQHPQLLTEWGIIWEEKAKFERAEAAKRENEARSAGKGRGRR
jgi:hypothetical protein